MLTRAKDHPLVATVSPHIGHDSEAWARIAVAGDRARKFIPSSCNDVKSGAGPRDAQSVLVDLDRYAPSLVVFKRKFAFEEVNP